MCPTDDPCCGRGVDMPTEIVAATHLHGISTSQPRRRRDPSAEDPRRDAFPSGRSTTASCRRALWSTTTMARPARQPNTIAATPRPRHAPRRPADWLVPHRRRRHRLHRLGARLALAGLRPPSLPPRGAGPPPAARGRAPPDGLSEAPRLAARGRLSFSVPNRRGPVCFLCSRRGARNIFALYY